MGIGKVRSVLFLLIIWRLCSVFVVQTFHVPDEYWQSLEVAHKLTFNYGHLTWEWTERIRSYIYPFLISILYKILHILSLDYTILLIYLPRIFQSLLTAYSDYRFYIWSKSKWSLFILSINWYWYYCSTRTLINSFETSLTIIALSHFPWKEKENNYSFLWIDHCLVVYERVREKTKTKVKVFFQRMQNLDFQNVYKLVFKIKKNIYKHILFPILKKQKKIVYQNYEFVYVNTIIVSIA